MKICRDCKIEKTEKSFGRHKNYKDGRDTLCKVCNQSRVKEWRKSNPGIPHCKTRKTSQASYRDILIELLIKRDGFSCGFCKESLEGSKVHIDHIVPIALGGENSFDNIRLSHPECNIAASIDIRRILHGH